MNEVTIASARAHLHVSDVHMDNGGPEQALAAMLRAIASLGDRPHLEITLTEDGWKGLVGVRGNEIAHVTGKAHLHEVYPILVEQCRPYVDEVV